MSKTRRGIVVILMLLAIGAAACRHGRGDSGTNILEGQVVDRTGNPVSGARVEAPGTSVTTDASGRFRLRAPAVARLPVSVTAAGYVNATRVFPTTKQLRGNVVVIWPRATPVTIDAASGGRVPFGNGGSITLPPNAMVDERGRALTGPANVSVTYFDVSDSEQLSAIPGDFTARMRDGSERRLQSYGVFEIFVSDSAGRRAELARGQTARVAIPIARSFVERAPRQTGSYSFDRNRGVWVEEGVLVRDDLVYSGTIDRFDWSWNADDPMDTTCMTFKVLATNGTDPEPNCLVKAEGVSYGSVSSGYTNAQGLVCLLVKRNDQVKVKAYSSTVVYYQSIPQVLTSPDQATGAADCGDPEKCPVTVIQLDIIVGGGG